MYLYKLHLRTYFIHLGNVAGLSKNDALNHYQVTLHLQRPRVWQSCVNLRVVPVRDIVVSIVALRKTLSRPDSGTSKISLGSTKTKLYD